MSNDRNVRLDCTMTSRHRQYEALRAYFVDKTPGPEVATRFGYTIGSFHQLVHQFRRSRDRQFFVDRERTTNQATDVIRQRIVQLRKQNLSVYDICEALKKEDISRPCYHSLSANRTVLIAVSKNLPLPHQRGGKRIPAKTLFRIT